MNQRQKTKYYVGGLYEVEIDGSGNERKLHYITAGDGPAAIFEKTATTENLYYIHKDHLGSFTSITDVNGTKVDSMNYDPWGRRRNPADWTFNNVPTNHLFDRGFTGHEHLDAFCLINMNGRVYDQTLGRFLSPDNYIQNPEQVQSYNRYSYALNNPLKYVDPSGQRISVADYHANYLHMSYSRYAEEQGSSGRGSRGGGSIGSGSGNGYSGRTTESSKTTWIQLGFFYYDESGNPVTLNGVNGEFWIYEAYVFDNNRSFGFDRNDFSAGNGNMWYDANSGRDMNSTNTGSPDWVNTTGIVLGASGTARGTKMAILDFAAQSDESIKNLKYYKGVKTVGRYAGGASVLITGAEVLYESEFRASHVLDVTMTGLSFIPGFGWAIGGGYFATNLIVNYTTGMDIGEHLDSRLNGGIISDW